MIDVPAIEHEGDVGVVGVPHSVSGAYIVGFVAHVLPAGSGDNEDVAAACRVVTIGDALAQERWHGCGQRFLEIDHIDELIDFLEFLDEGLLHLAELLAACGDGLMVEIDASGIFAKDDMLYALNVQFVHDGTFNAFHLVPHLQSARRDVVSFHHIGIVGSAVVGREEHEVVALAYFLIEHVEEVGQLAVEFHIGSVVFGAACANGMADDVGRRDADGEHVGDVVLTHLLVLKGGDGHLEGLGDAFGRALDIEARFRTNLIVGLLDPFGQLIHVVG